ncbi:MAG: gamma-glutamyltransferase [Desulfocapsaceae bacterium]|nr:gamma-glutamyltransferase [Desulfocapsaceae bacterium]
MSDFKKGIVASGHILVGKAAAKILREGGNAFDAVVAAGFASTVVEQTLTSLGGGGLLLGHSAARGQNLFFDFFVDTPGLGNDGRQGMEHFFPVTIQFSGAPQVFNIGLGSVAVPGIAKGLLHVHKRLGSMPLKEIVAPAIDYARGHEVNNFQADFLKLLTPIMTQTATGRSLYGNENGYIAAGDWLCNDELAQFLELLIEDGGDSFYRGDIARAIAAEMREKEGLVTEKDLASYRVMERKPLAIQYRGSDLVTSPYPSLGGALIALSLAIYKASSDKPLEWGSRNHLLEILAVTREVERLRGKNITDLRALFAFLNKGLGKSVENVRLFSRGTTHISIADRKGNCASMTCSNGEGSGYFAPGTGVMLNNMMGEDDLHPNGFHSSPPGQRVCSMMSPSLLLKDDVVKLVIGSGGSKRIRTAITEVLRQVVDFGKGIKEAVEAPRLYWDDECLQVEPGFDEDIVNSLGIDTNIWQKLDVYFGGVHAVIPGSEGAGDPRRGGCVIEV